MSKQILCVAMLIMLSVVLPSMGGTYNYGSTLDMTDGTWTLSNSGLYWSAIYSSTLDAHQVQFTQVLGYGEDIANRGAYVWNAPEGEAITMVQFYWWRSGDQADFKFALYTQNVGDTLDNATIAWSTNANNAMYADGSQTVNFALASNVKSIGLGFVDVWSATGCSVLFNTVTIITEPAPKHVVSGTVAAGSFSGDLSDMGIKVEFAQNGTVVNSGKTFLNADGTYSIPGVVEGTYDVTIKSGFWFKKTIMGVVVLNDVTLPTVTPVQGDLNADNAVNVSDLSLLAANYGTGSAQTLNWAADYAAAFGTTTSNDTTADTDTAETTSDSAACSGVGLSLIAGLAMMGLMLVKLEE